jgi:hypothetical protein
VTDEQLMNGQLTPERLATLETKLKHLEDQYRSLTIRYERAGANIKTEAHSHMAYIQYVRQEAEQVLELIRGGALFGRYSADADEHKRIADSWRRAAVAALLVTLAGIVALAIIWNLPTATLAVCMVPAAGLFFYASLESHNHRRREFDRRRIALRMSAIESYMQNRQAKLNDESKVWSVLDDFIAKHFIAPDLDSNDMSYLGPRDSIFALFQRKSQP